MLISALLILLTGCVLPDESPGYTPGTITGTIAAPCCSASDALVSETCCIAPEYWCYYCKKDWNLQKGIAVILTYGENEVAATTTNDQGEFIFTNVDPGKNYVVTAYCPGYDDDRPLVKDVALELIEGGFFDTRITDIVSTSLGLVVDFLVDFTMLGPEDIVLDEVIADKPDFKKFPKFRKLIYEVVRVLEACQDVNTDVSLQYALCRAAEEISGLTIGCNTGYTSSPPGPVSYTLITAAVPQAGGAVSGAGTYNAGTVVPVTTSPNPGWSFTGWSGDLSSTTNPQNITMNSNKSVTANFTQNEYTLTVLISPAGAETAGCAVDRDIAGPYNYGDVVQLTSNAADGWTFDHWSGDLTGSTDPDDVTIDGDKTVTAVFTQNEYTLTVNIVGNGSVTLAPSGGTYLSGTAVTLGPQADSGWTFTGWSGANAGDISATAPYIITMNDDKAVTANFEEDTGCLLVKVYNPTGEGFGAGTVILFNNSITYGPYNTAGNGWYTFTNIPVGTYTLKADRPGAPSWVRPSIEVIIVIGTECQEKSLQYTTN